MGGVFKVGKSLYLGFKNMFISIEFLEFCYHLVEDLDYVCMQKKKLFF